ncbi:hypothetical protein, partial [Candidatus Hakubella thermalkaliphila]
RQVGIWRLDNLRGGESMKKGKRWWKSRTLWVNVLALIVLIFGLDLSGDETAAVLVTINLVLRKITKEPLVW